MIGGGGIGSLTCAKKKFLNALATACERYRHQRRKTDRYQDRRPHQSDRQPGWNAVGLPDGNHGTCGRPGSADEETRDEVRKGHKAERLRNHRITERTEHLAILGAPSQTPAHRHEEPRSAEEQNCPPSKTSQQPRDRGDDPHQHQSETHDESRCKTHDHRFPGAGRVLGHLEIKKRVELKSFQHASCGSTAASLSVVVVRGRPPRCVGQYCHRRSTCPNSPVSRTCEEAYFPSHRSDWSTN